MKKPVGVLFFWLYWGLAGNFTGAQSIDKTVFLQLSGRERLQWIHRLPFEKMDSARIATILDGLLALAESKKDDHCIFVLQYHRFLHREKLALPEAAIFRLLSGLKNLADQQGWKTEQIVAGHYLAFQRYTTNRLPHEQMYLEVIKTFERLEEQGFENFRDYGVEQILYHLGRFMWDLGDFEKAFQSLHVAEQFIQPTEAGEYHYTVILNLLQTYFQQKKDYEKAIEYARRIFEFHKDRADTAAVKNWNNLFWQGLAALDIAAMRLEQGDFAAGEHYAALGYALSRVSRADRGYSAWYAEFDALQVLLSIKLKTGQIEEAARLIQRSEDLKKILDQAPDLTPFRYLKFYGHRARYSELRGEFDYAMQWTRKVESLQDSLDRRNDARKFEQIKRRHEAEKYLSKIRLVENEKRFHQGLLLASLVILVLLTIVVYLNYGRLLTKRAEAEAAKNDLEATAQAFREKSELVENLRLELDKMAIRNEQSEYLEQLTQHAILTEEDWLRFRRLFDKVHPGFLNEQKAQYPDLTTAELRLLALEKLGLSDMEIANILGIGAKTVHQTRWRMRKKLD